MSMAYTIHKIVSYDDHRLRIQKSRMQEAVRLVSAQTNLRPDEILSKHGKRSAEAKKLLAIICRRQGMAHKDVAALMGLSPSAVSHHVTTAQGLLETDWAFAAAVRGIEAQLEGRAAA